jgi:hypothetical protein
MSLIRQVILVRIPHFTVPMFFLSSTRNILKDEEYYWNVLSSVFCYLKDLTLRILLSLSECRPCKKDEMPSTIGLKIGLKLSLDQMLAPLLTTE